MCDFPTSLTVGRSRVALWSMGSGKVRQEHSHCQPAQVGQVDVADSKQSKGHPTEGFDRDEAGESYVYLTDGDLERVLEEPELQVILSTYKEVKRTIQSQQKGHQFSKAKGKARGSPWKEYTKDKRRAHIEQLKLRTRCARCGAVGHWAREYKAPDEHGRASNPASSAKSTVQSSSASGGQSWYVSSEAGTSQSLCSRCIYFGCGGNHTQAENSKFLEGFPLVIALRMSFPRVNV